MGLNKGDYMSNTKHLADLMKVCSILPVFAVMPAMAEDLRLVVDSEQTVTTGISNSYYSDGRKGGGAIEVLSDGVLTVAGGAYVNNSTTGNYGGAIYNKGMIISIDSGFSGNKILADDEKADGFGAGGAIATMSTIGDINADFINNSVSGLWGKGGAIYTINEHGFLGEINSINGSFIGNSVDADYEAIGGAITNDGNIGTIVSEQGFVNNTAISGYDAYAGALYNSENATIKNIKADFIGNNATGEADVYGGAIVNKGTINNITGVFQDNFVQGASSENYIEGGAIYNKNKMNITASEFVGNKSLNIVEDEKSVNGKYSWSYGGAIKNSGTLTINDTNFYDNIAYTNGAVSTSPKDGVTTTITGGRFEDNHAFADGGALGLYSVASVNGTWFVENSAGMDKKIGDTVYEKAYDTNGGGALFVGQKGKVTLTDVHFVDNETGVNGGAIHARHFLNQGYLDIVGDKQVVTFDDNEAANYGGAISNIYGGVINISNAKFTLNDAGKLGGAIYNGVGENWGTADTPSSSSGDGTINFTNVQFIDNEAVENGGAIYNDTKGTMTFAGINTFANNKKHVGKYVTTNDIHNLGNISVVSGTTALSGGVTGTGTFTIAEGAELYIGSSNIEQSSIVIDGTVFADVLTDGSSAYIDRAEKPENIRENNGGTYAKLLGNVTGSGSINLNIGSVGTYKMFSQENDVTINAGKAYEVTKDGTDVKIALKSVEKMAGDTGLSQRAAGAISSLATSSNRGIQMVSLAAQKLLNSDDPDAVAKIEQETAKLNPEDKPVTQSVTTSLNNQVLSLTAGRMSGGAPMVGRSGGDNGESGIWMQGLYNQSKSGDAFDGKTRGFALGADTLVANKYTLGLGFAYNNTDVSSGTRDTEIDSKTLFLYGQYKPNKWFANATLAYTMSEYTENTDPFGVAIESTYDVDAYGAQLMTGYDFATGITTEMGMRYLHIAQEEYDNGVNSIAAQDTDFLTAVAGLKYAFYVQTDDMLKFRPELRAALTYDVINDDNHATVMLPGVGTSYNVDGKALNKLGGEFGIGLTAEYKGMEFSVMYDLDLHEDYTSQTGMIKFRGRF